MSDARLLLFPPGLAFAEAVARRLVAQQRARLPDLSALTLIVAAPALIAPLRTALARAAGGAVLAPRLLTLAAWAAEHLPEDSAAPLPALACRMRLGEWLGRLQSVFPGQDPLRLADALFPLFESLALNAVRLPDGEAAFAAQLRAAYGAPELEALSREAQIVHRLWRAYVEEIGDRAPAIAHLRGLRLACEQARDCLLLGFDVLDRAEASLLRAPLAEGRVALWTRGRAEGRDGAALRELASRLGAGFEAADSEAGPRGRLLDALFIEAAESSRARARALAGSGATGIRLVAASSPEQEARIVDLAVREALLAGARRVAVISSDRRLARRLRALLERAGLGLEDCVGWALSTSRAAAALSAWLECLESGFHFRPLLDLLKSGFFVGEPLERPEPLLAARLERVLYFPANDAAPPPVSGLAALSEAVDGAFPALFERLRRAALDLPVAANARPAEEWPRAVLASLASVGLLAGLADDDAGSQVVAALRSLEAALAGLPLALRWDEFRALLDRHLEDSTFRPAPAGEGAPRVALYNLQQTQGLHCDAVVLASATRAQLPGSAPGEVFFNQAVRRELGLDGWDARQALAVARLRALLEAAPQVLVSYAADSDGEPAQPSPWLEALAAFAEAAGHAPLHDASLAARATHAATQVASAEPTALAPSQQPAPPAVARLLVTRLSASGHQSLIDCPYRWHAQYALRLATESDPDAPVSRADFGERVHLILRSFYEPYDAKLPPPYAGALDEASREAVQAHLETLADAVFADDLAARPLARIWRREFTALAPWLTQQLIARGDARVQPEFELPVERAGWTLRGKIDRLERRPEGLAVIDYKTGRSVPAEDDIVAGEAVQLPHYALEVGDALGIEYWKLAERDERKRISAIAGEALDALLAGIEERLTRLRADLEAGHPLPANGDEASCSRCDFAGVCRHGAWNESA